MDIYIAEELQIRLKDCRGKPVLASSDLLVADNFQISPNSSAFPVHEKQPISKTITINDR